MADSTMTKTQGDEIIRLLGEILWTLRQTEKTLDRIGLTTSNIEFEVAPKS